MNLSADKCEKVRVDLGDRSYEILFTPLQSDAAVGAFSALPQKNILLTADSNTAAYLPLAAGALEKAGKQVNTFVFPAGESSKTIETAMQLCARASELGMGRNSLFAALGGGVTGDLTGFAASIFMRGVPFIQLPTSLLAMVDSSVGGKTAVDTAAGKNLVGAFHQPSLVVIDCDMLKTLPAREWGSGTAEIVKTAMIKDAGFAEKLLASPVPLCDDPALLQYAVKRSCEIKAAVVSADEKESGDSGRIFLNYGHTFGHALEHLSHFQLTHGEAVAIGMDMAAFAAVEMGLCGKELLDYQHRLLSHAGIAPESFADRPLEKQTGRIVEVMKGDKKNGDGKFRAVLPLQCGKVQTVALDADATAAVLTGYYNFRFGKNFGNSAADTRPRAVILGLGLLGTSLALSLDRQKYCVGAWNRNQAVCRWALENNVAEKIYATAENALADADIAILCLPIPVTVDFIRRYGKNLKPGGIMTDIASIKGEIIAAADSCPDLRFVGSHPMAGTEKSGHLAGFNGLYRNADIFVVPGKYSTEEDIQSVCRFWRSLDAHIKPISAEDHDKLVAHTSHMLHIIASALTQSILDRDDAAEQRRNYSGCATGFRDTSRIASSSPEMWREICVANTPAILPALDAFEQRMTAMRQALVAGDGEKFENLFRLGRDLRDSWLCYKNSHALPQNIVLCGIKHCGKSTIGKALADVMALELTDTDELISKSDPQQRSVREIFREDGEESFRKLEAGILQQLAASPVRRIIALGGGALTNPFLTEQIRTSLGFTVWIDVDDAVAFERILKAGLPPFLASEADPQAAFAAMNLERKAVFARCADARITPESTPHRSALHILSLYKDKLLNK